MLLLTLVTIALVSTDALVLAPGYSIGLGCMGITAFYGPAITDDEAVALLQAAQKAGCKHFDTAEVYQQFSEIVPGASKLNEDVVGKFLKTQPADCTVATKYFPGLHGGACDYETVSAAVDASRARLGVQSIDLYYLHRMPDTVEEMEEWVRSMKTIVESGRGELLPFEQAARVAHITYRRIVSPFAQCVQLGCQRLHLPGYAAHAPFTRSSASSKSGRCTRATSRRPWSRPVSSSASVSSHTRRLRATC